MTLLNELVLALWLIVAIPCLVPILNALILKLISWGW